MLYGYAVELGSRGSSAFGPDSFDDASGRRSTSSYVPGLHTPNCCASVTDEPGYHDLRFTPVYARYETEPVAVLRSPSCTGRLDMGAAQPVFLMTTCPRKVDPRGIEVGNDAPVRDNR